MPPFFGPGLCDSHGCLSAALWRWLPGRSSTALSDLGGGVVVQARVWPGLVVDAAVLLDDDRRFVHGKERLLIETFVPETAVKALAHAILPRLPGINVGRRDALSREPPLDPPGDEFRPVVAAQIVRRTAAGHQLREDRQDAIAGQRAGHRGWPGTPW